MTKHWPHQVEIKLDRASAAERLRRIEAWCTDWQVGFRVLGTMTEDLIRVAFEERSIVPVAAWRAFTRPRTWTSTCAADRLRDPNSRRGLLEQTGTQPRPFSRD